MVVQLLGIFLILKLTLCPSVWYLSTQHIAHVDRKRGRWESHSSEAEQSELSVDGP